MICFAAVAWLFRGRAAPLRAFRRFSHLFHVRACRTTNNHRNSVTQVTVRVSGETRSETSETVMGPMAVESLRIRNDPEIGLFRSAYRGVV